MNVDTWRWIGLAGTGLFASRWLVQAWAARRAGRPVVPAVFWMMSAGGSAVLVLYFSVGPKADVVGLLGQGLPFLVALYNLALHRRARRHV